MTDVEFVAALECCSEQLMELMWEMERRSLTSDEYAALREAREKLIEVGAPIFKRLYEAKE